jgi:hypothetical protein
MLAPPSRPDPAGCSFREIDIALKSNRATATIEHLSVASAPTGSGSCTAPPDGCAGPLPDLVEPHPLGPHRWTTRVTDNNSMRRGARIVTKTRASTPLTTEGCHPQRAAHHAKPQRAAEEMSSPVKIYGPNSETMKGSPALISARWREQTTTSIDGLSRPNERVHGRRLRFSGDEVGITFGKLGCFWNGSVGARAAPGWRLAQCRWRRLRSDVGRAARGCTW